MHLKVSSFSSRVSLVSDFDTTTIIRADDSLVVGLQCSGSTGWGFVGEMSSQRLRPYTAGFAAAISCVGGVIMNVLVPYMLNENQW